ncbi:MAG: hypothetical protein RR490_04085 [Niameybacter sp.]
MSTSYFLLIVLCVIALMVLMLNIGIVQKKENVGLKWVCTVLFGFAMMRYLTRIVYGDHPTLGQLEILRYFYLATSIGLTITMASAVWSITPFIKEKLSYFAYLICFIPWILFYLYVIVTQPTQIEPATFGYTLVLTGKFPIYLSVVQGSFVAIMILLCTIGFFSYKNEYLRSSYALIIAACVLLTLDGIGYFVKILNIIPPFTATEIFGFMAIAYAFYIQPVKRRV